MGTPGLVQGLETVLLRTWLLGRKKRKAAVMKKKGMEERIENITRQREQ